MIGKRIQVTGVVQGVGFRPFVYGLATRHGLAGWVCNTSAGVDIEVEGQPAAVDAFVQGLTAEAPPLSRIDSLTVTDIPLNGYQTFEIRHSVAQAGRFQPISPDVCTCSDCLRELFDPTDRRYRYPFINCTNCGPRFTIIQDIPYDRPKTTMRVFPMCPACQAEYDDPLNRRFHAQPNACPECGPHVWFASRTSQVTRENCDMPPATDSWEAIEEVRRLLAQGAVVAVKGLGGFHLACDASNDEAVRRLRERKGRVDKPFAIMSFDVAAVERYCFVNDEERRLLESRERPIVLLRERPDSPISEWVAPGNKYLGVMLPYTPLHYLLLTNGVQSPISNLQPLALVMTSGNYAEEPIATDNQEALDRLAGLADAFLLHNRDIHARCDDSVVRVFQGAELPVRRSRGYAPFPVRLPFRTRQVLAVGAELKNTFCITRDEYAFLSQHIGDMENLETLRSFEEMIEHFKGLFRVEPEVIAHDMHPDYLSTQYAKQFAIRNSQFALVAVQHHHAHVAACMAEHGLSGERPVIGVAFDGTGYGTDGAIWGGEFLVADYAGFQRAAHLAYVPLPGGDAAIRRPYRTALAHLWHAFGTLDVDVLPRRVPSEVELGVLRRQLERGLNAPPTSSMGRLFDAVAALAAVRQVINYEAQAAIELEMLAEEEVEDAYVWEMRQGTSDKGPGTRDEGRSSQWVVDPAPVIRGVVADVQAGVPAPVISAKFHNAVAALIRDVCERLRDEAGLDEVALSGGVFQNVTLLAKAVELLRRAGFTAYTHRLVPPNDGGIALGQAVVANSVIRDA